MKLLERFGVDPALIGDLSERRAQGSSMWWLWRQATLALFITITGDITSHWVLALRALAVGAITMQVLSLALKSPGLAASQWFGVTAGNLLLEWNLESLRWNFFVYHLWSLPQVLMSAVIGACAAFLISRTHRAQSMSMVIVFLFVTELLRTYQIVERWRWAAVSPRMNQWPYQPILTAIILVPTMLMVGLWSSSHHAPADTTPQRP